MSSDQKIRWQNDDTLWVLTLFGTAVGAGILFLPIQAGIAGIWPFFALTFFIVPIVYLSHKFFAYFVLSADNDQDDITLVARKHFGVKIGMLITFVYFLAIFPILLIYGVGLTNTTENFIVHQLHLPKPSRALTSCLLTGGMMSVMYFSEKTMLAISKYLVFPLILLLFFVSIYLIPHWNLAAIRFVPKFGDFFKIVVLTLPVLIFSFNHSPAISSFVLAQRKYYRDAAEKKVVDILRVSSGVIFAFSIFFVFSCILTVSPEALLEARKSNISIITYLANYLDRPGFSIVASFIGITAITTSFFGHYLGAREGFKGVIYRIFQLKQHTIHEKKIDFFTMIFFFCVIWGVAYLNPSILSLLEVFVGPIIALLLFIMPVIAIYKAPALAKYRDRYVGLVFIFLVGLLTISVLLFSR